MPIPQPQKGEDQDTFHSRCMGDTTMGKDYPDQAQRNAVCYRAWDEAHPEHPHKKSEHGYLPETAACWSNHMGIWAIEPVWFGAAVTAYKEGLWLPRPQTLHKTAVPVRIGAFEDGIDIEASERRPYSITQKGTAIIPLSGPLTKAGSWKFDGTSTVRTRRMLRMAAADDDVANILLHVDSPGGHVAGVDALASEVASIKTHKPIIAHIDDLGASAAYWVSSQADAIYASPTSEVGGLGTVAVVEDTSGRMDRLGVKVHVISTGPYKGAGAEGVPVTEKTLEYLQERVNALNHHFMAAVRGGRRLSEEQLAAVADGRVFIADQAHRLGLLDGVQSLDATLERMPGRVSAGGARGTYRRPSAAQERVQRVLAAHKECL